jgi:hypothetical protein
MVQERSAGDAASRTAARAIRLRAGSTGTSDGMLERTGRARAAMRSHRSPPNQLDQPEPADATRQCALRLRSVEAEKLTQTATVNA